MKAEYNGSDRHNSFSKLHHPFSHHHFSDHRHQLSDDDVATSTAAAPFISKHADDATVEVPRRKRGRPPGSKNKPKKLKSGDVRAAAGEPNPGADMSPYILEVAAGNDIVEAVSRFCRRKGTGLCILSASGTVANFTLRQPRPVRDSTSPPPSVTFHGRFDILSISATFLHYMQPANQIPSGFSIFLAGPQGQVVGGTVAGPLVTAGPVFVVAVWLNNPSHQKLPDDDNDEDEEDCNWKSVASESQSLGSGDGVDSGNTPPQPQSEVARMRSMYSCHMGSDVVWAPPSGSSRHY